MPTDALVFELHATLHKLILADGPRTAALTVANAFEYLAGRRELMLVPEGDPVLTDAELARLEAERNGTWISARHAFAAVRDDIAPAHVVLIALGRQLSARYRKQTKRGSTRLYWVEAPARPAQAIGPART